MAKVMMPAKNRKPDSRGRKKAWIRDRAFELIQHEPLPETDARRTSLAYGAIELAAKIWDQVESRFMTPEGNGHDD